MAEGRDRRGQRVHLVIGGRKYGLSITRTPWDMELNVLKKAPGGDGIMAGWEVTTETAINGGPIACHSDDFDRVNHVLTQIQIYNTIQASPPTIPEIAELADAVRDASAVFEDI